MYAFLGNTAGSWVKNYGYLCYSTVTNPTGPYSGGQGLVRSGYMYIANFFLNNFIKMVNFL
jgi:hypothetical protein